MIQVGSDFSGVGAFNQALIRLGIDYEELFACDIDKYARQTFVHNYGQPRYFPENVYDRKIPKKSLDIYMTSPPCQAFSLAGKRKGEDDKRGVLFYNSHEFIVKNNPRYFIFENVKGLLSDAQGRTFQNWCYLLGGKSINGNPVIFPLENATPYHIYYRVLNAKKYGVPQNRERVFIVGIRDDADNNFNWPKKEYLTKRLKDVLEKSVDQKYYLSDKMMDYLNKDNAKFNNGKVNYKYDSDIASCITKSSSSISISDNILKIKNINPSGNGMNGNVYDSEAISPTITMNNGEGIKIKTNTKKGFEVLEFGSSINLSYLYSKTRRGRIGKQIAQCLDSGCDQGVLIAGTRVRNTENPLSIKKSGPTAQRLELNMKGISNALTTIQKDNVLVSMSSMGDNVAGNYTIRRLTPRECFRLMGFPDTFKWPVSDRQAYMQAGNSIVVNVLVGILKKLKL